VRVFRAEIIRRRAILVGTLIFVALAGWAYRHVYATIAAIHGHGATFGVVYTISFLLLTWQMMLAFLERPHVVTRQQQLQLDGLHVAASVPVFNEDPTALRRGLESLLLQTRPLNTIYVVDDGSKLPQFGGPDYSSVKKWFLAEAASQSVRGEWVRQINGGKRSAQGRMVVDTPEADVYLTLDSDSLLDPTAVDEALKPLANPEIYSVAGVVFNLNNTGRKCTPSKKLIRRVEHVLVARVSSLWFLVGQLVDRSAASTFGAVLVNSGPLALYRASVLRDNLDGYLNEKFFGRSVELSDDSMLTIYALMKGKAVQQPTAFSFSLMPETVQHHIRQYVRWMRGAFIRTFWRFRYLPLSGWAFWSHTLGWAQMGVSTMIFIFLFIVAPARHPQLIENLPFLVIIPISIGLGQALRTLLIQRNDESLWSQLLTVALAPLTFLWSFFVLRIVRWYAMATCLKTGWGTRQNVEIAMVHHGELDTVVLSLEQANTAPIILPRTAMTDTELTTRRS
jgi:hyaluronan synthase